MADPHGPLSEHIQYTVTDREVDESWQRLDSALRPERRFSKPLVFAGVGVALVAIVIGVSSLRRAPSEGVLEPGAMLAAGTAPLQTTLREGSTVRADAASKGALEVATASEVRVRLDEGSMHFDVARNPSRRFVVKAGRVEVRVIGTAFTVRRSTTVASVSVTVDRGIVEVWIGDVQRAVLNAGQTWNEPVETAAIVEPQPAIDVEASAVELEQPTKRTATPIKKKSVVAKVVPAETPAPTVVTPALPDDPSTLFRLALDARRAGRAGEAADAFGNFLSKFPDDSRSGLVLFELGRLQMDQLHASGEAVKSLERAIAKAPQGSYAEDAMARLVQLHHDRKEAAACREARDGYLKRFPAGVHAATLGALCSF